MSELTKVERQRNAVSRIVASYRQKFSESLMPIPFRNFAERINGVTRRYGREITGAAIQKWEKGNTLPMARIFNLLEEHSENSLKEFAQDVLAALFDNRPAVSDNAKQIIREELPEHAQF